MHEVWRTRKFVTVHGCYCQALLPLESLLLPDVEPPNDLDLTEPEQCMWSAVMTGHPYNFGDDDPRELNSTDEWGKERTISGQVLAELLLRAGTGRPPAIRQVRIQGARVTGEVDLSHAEVEVAVHFEQCLFEHDVILQFARARTLQLEACVLPSIDAMGAAINGDLEIGQSDIANAVYINDTRVSHSVEISGSKIAGKSDHALSAHDIRVGGSLFLNSGFRAAGEVRLLNARIAGQLNCVGGRFANTGGVALTADGADIGGGAFLSDSFHAQGEVRLPGARITGQLNCAGGRFDNAGGYALSAESLEICGSVLLGKLSSGTDRFHATGEVRLPGSRITGQLDCAGGQFDNLGGCALSANKMEI